VRIQPVGGGELRFTPAGKTAHDKNMAGLKDGSVEDTARTLCTRNGVARLLESLYPFQVIRTLGQVTIVYENEPRNPVGRHDEAACWVRGAFDPASL